MAAKPWTERELEIVAQVKARGGNLMAAQRALRGAGFRRPIGGIRKKLEGQR